VVVAHYKIWKICLSFISKFEKLYKIWSKFKCRT